MSLPRPTLTFIVVGKRSVFNVRPFNHLNARFLATTFGSSRETSKCRPSFLLA